VIPYPLSTARWRCVALAIAVAAMFGCGKSAPVLAVDVIRPAYITVARADAPDGLAFMGEVRAVRRAELAFAVSGRVTQVLVQAGDAVRQGQVLAVLDVLPLKAQLATASAELRRGEAQLKEARQRMERLSVAQISDAVSAAETGTTQTELTSAEAAVQGMQAQRDAAAWSLEQATMRAPLDGFVAARSLEVGQAVGVGVPAITIDGAGRELSMLVPVNLSLKAGQPVGVYDGVTRLSSKVLRIGNRLEAGGVRKVFLNAPDDAAIGATWTVTLDATTAHTTVWVPLRAVLPGSIAGTGSVLRLAKDGSTTELATLKLGEPHGDWIEVSAGLTPGDRVVIAGAAAIRPGTRVKPLVMAHLETLP